MPRRGLDLCIAISYPSSLQELVGNVDVFAPDVLAQIFAQAIERRRRIESSVKMVFKQEVDNTHMRHLESIDAVAKILFAEQRDELLCC
jgi:hypothetical protein